MSDTERVRSREVKQIRTPTTRMTIRIIKEKQQQQQIISKQYNYNGNLFIMPAINTEKFENIT